MSGMIRRIEKKQRRKREAQDKIEHIHEKLLAHEAEEARQATMRRFEKSTTAKHGWMT